MAGRAARDAVPALNALRARAETLREQALREASGDAEKATRLLLGRLLHDPTTALKRAASTDGAELAMLETALDRLFGLSDGNDDSDDESHEDDQT